LGVRSGVGVGLDPKMGPATRKPLPRWVEKGKSNGEPKVGMFLLEHL